MNGADWRVLLTTDAVGGVWRYTIELAQGLARLGVAPAIAALGPPCAAHQIAEARASGIPLVALDQPLDWLAATPDEVAAGGEAVAALARAMKAHVVHLHSAAYAADVRFPAPTVAMAHSCLVTWRAAVKPAEPPPADFAWRAAQLRRGLARVDRIAAPSASFAAATKIAHGLSRTPRVVRNGRSPLRGAGEAMAQSAFAAGRLWDEGKGAKTLDRAAQIARTPIYAAGAVAAPHGGRVRLEHVRLLGEIDAAAMAARLAARPIFVSAASYEPFGLAVLEAAMAGCPLVLSDIATFRELWRGAALFVAADDVQGFATAIDGLAEDAAARAHLGAAARRRAERYSLAAMADATMALYRDLVPAAPVRVVRRGA